MKHLLHALLLLPLLVQADGDYACEPSMSYYDMGVTFFLLLGLLALGSMAAWFYCRRPWPHIAVNRVALSLNSRFSVAVVWSLGDRCSRWWALALDSGNPRLHYPGSCPSWCYHAKFLLGRRPSQGMRLWRRYFPVWAGDTAAGAAGFCSASRLSRVSETIAPTSFFRKGAIARQVVAKSSVWFCMAQYTGLLLSLRSLI